MDGIIGIMKSVRSGEKVCGDDAEAILENEFY